MLHVVAVPGHVDGLDGAKRSEGLSDGVITQLKVDTANVYSEGREREIYTKLIFFLLEYYYL